MRLMEVVIIALTFASLTLQFLSKTKDSGNALVVPLITVTIIPVHLLVEGYRWQMVPALILTLLLAIFALTKHQALRKRATPFIRSRAIRILLTALACLLFIVSVIFPALLPVPHLPQPTGEYAVGTTSLKFIDSQREEHFTAEPGDVRSILVTAWYPADPDTTAKTVSYWDQENITGKAYTQSADMGTFWYTHLNQVQTNSYPDAPVAADEQAYPVLLYSPSFIGLNTENTMLFEELASQGYVVLSVAHSYESIVALLPDGQAIYSDYEYITNLYDDNWDKEKQLWTEFSDATSETEKQDIITHILGIDDQSTHMVRARTEDMLFIINQLESLNNSHNIFASRLDMDNIGIMGYSFGGATAIDTSILDGRIKATVNIDGWPYGEQFTTGAEFEQPFLLVSNDEDSEDNRIVADLMLESTNNTAYEIVIEDTDHGNFWDFPLFFDIYKYLGYWDHIPAERLLEIESTYIGAFFDTYLTEQGTRISDISSDSYPEVILKTIVH